MEIFFSDIPEEGLPISGKLKPTYFNLSDDDSIRITGEVTYELTIYAFEEVIVLSGYVEGACDLQCVTCLDYFSYDAIFDQWNSEVDIEDGEVKFDPRESLRDEILLALPTVPHCDELMDNRKCPKVSLLEKFEHDEQPFEPEASPEEKEDIWGALDQLDPGGKQ